MARDDDENDDERPRKKRAPRDDNDTDDDDRPRKKSKPRDDEATDDDERPRKKPTSRDDEDEDDERPRKKSSSRDDDDDDDDDRPRKKRSSRDDDDDDDDDRRSKKKKKAGLPGLLLACAIVSLSVGGVCMLMHCGLSIDNTVGWVQIMRARVFGMLPGSFKFLLIFTSLTNVLTALAAIALLGAGILLMLRKSAGKIPALGAPIALFVLPIVDIIVSASVLGGFVFRGWHVAILILTIVMGLGAGICNFLALFNQGVNKALR